MRCDAMTVAYKIIASSPNLAQGLPTSRENHIGGVLVAKGLVWTEARLHGPWLPPSLGIFTGGGCNTGLSRICI